MSHWWSSHLNDNQFEQQGCLFHSHSKNFYFLLGTQIFCLQLRPAKWGVASVEIFLRPSTGGDIGGWCPGGEE